MNRVSSHMAGSEDGRMPSWPAVDAESEQLDIRFLPAAANNPGYSLQTTIHQNPTLMQSNLLAPPTLPLQANETSPLILTALMANHHPLDTVKAVLKVNGRLTEMAAKWSEEEWANHRRIVQFKRSRQDGVLSVEFKSIAVHERLANSICISCIWWADKSDCYFTSVDIMHLLEQLIAAPNRFAVEEKNRIRSYLEGFHPVTISKTRPNDSEFFKMVMAFGHPIPRNMKKNFKVFPWPVLEPMLKKIISKYSVMPPESSDHNTGLALPLLTLAYNNALRVSRYAGKLPPRKGGRNSEGNQATSSKLPRISHGRPGNFLKWLEDTLFYIVKDLNADEAVRERLLGVFPDLLGAFALKIGYNMPARADCDAAYFIQKYRQEVNKLQD